MSDHFTLHIRLTKSCNADCSYCSSFQQVPSKPMTIEQFEKSINFISTIISNKGLGGKRDFLSVNFVGGEIGILPSDYVKEANDIVKKEMSKLFKKVATGCQSNLLLKESNLTSLVDVFGQNIGSSLEMFGKQRTYKGSESKFKTIWLTNAMNLLDKQGKWPSSILVLDEEGCANAIKEWEWANRRRMGLTLRPVFNGGITTERMNSTKIAEVCSMLFAKWIESGVSRIEPFATLATRRAAEKGFVWNDAGNQEGCPFQNDCAFRSLDLEPNGDLYQCLDLADTEDFLLGNALNMTWDDDVWTKLAGRAEALPIGCRDCSYKKSCKGGCGAEAVWSGKDFHDGKTDYCPIWKQIFADIDNVLSSNPERLRELLEC